MTGEQLTSCRRFGGRTAIVTGGSRGIGLAIAQRLVREGARVVITARKAQDLADAVSLLGGEQKAIGISGHADDENHRDGVISAALAAFGSVDLLVNNVAINPVYGKVLDGDPGAARKIFDVNCVGAVSWIGAVHRAWMEQHGGAVVNLSSVAGIRPAAGIGWYGASKAWIAHMTQQLAVEMSPHVRINAIAPAVVKTKFATALYEGREVELAGLYPLNRLGRPEDIAGVAAFLLSEDAAWMTGQLLSVDGGALLPSPV